MSKLKHTPGPWKTEGEGLYITKENEFTIANIRGWGHLGKLGEEKAIEIQKANALLIAAAPEMLDCLVQLNSTLVKYLENDPDFCVLLDKINIEALIEKATGQKIEEIIK